MTLQEYHDALWSKVKRLSRRSNPYETQQIGAELNTCCVALSHAMKAGDKRIALAWLDAYGREEFLRSIYSATWSSCTAERDFLRKRLAVYEDFRTQLEEIHA